MSKILALLPLWLAFLFVMSSAQVSAQKTVKGTVTDAADGSGLPGASIVVNGTTVGTITDFDGNYSLVVPTGKDEILVSMVGYVSVVQKIGNLTTINVELKTSVQAIDEVVVTGYGGTQTRARSTNSIAKVDSKKLSTGVFSNPAQALSGAVPGLRVVQTSGNPGATPTIILRGGTNLDGSGSPLVIVDGQIRGSLSDINPEDVEDMQVMKDAGATAIYGARANNGVILIKTKTGKAGQSEINVKAKMGVNYLNNPYEFADAETYLTWMRPAYVKANNIWKKADGTGVGYATNIATLTGAQPYGTGNAYFAADGTTPLINTTNSIWSTMYLTEQNKFLLNQGWQTMKDPVYAFLKGLYPNDATISENLIFRNTTPADYNFKNPSYTQDYNINMSGGNDKGHYYAGIGYNHSQGLPVSSFYKRFSFVLNGDYQVKPWLTSTSSFNFNRANWQSMPGSQGSEANYFSRVLSLPPTVRFASEDGTPRLGNNSGDGNQNYQEELFFVFNQTDKFTMNQSFKVDFTKDLFLKLSANLYYSEGYYESFNRDFRTSPTAFNTNRSTSASFDRTIDQTYNAVLNYQKQLGEHFFSALAGAEYYDTYSYGFAASGSGAATDDFRDLALTSADKDKRSIDSYHVQQRILSFFGRANYDYMGKYLLSLVMRQDGYSRLIDNRWGTFPGASAGWIFTKESFAKSLSDVLSFGKLKASYGLNGNVSGIGAYELQGSYVGSTKYNGTSTFILGSVPNPSLRWEKTRTLEAGLDLGYLDNRFSTNFTIYDRLTSDKFATLSLPISSGISGIRTNNGQFRNRGVEIELGAKPIRSKTIQWNINANISYNKNTIVKLPDNGLPLNRQGAFQVYSGKDATDLIWVGGYQEGQEPGALYVWQAEGLYKSASDIPANRIVKPITFQGATTRTLYGTADWAALTEAQKISTRGLPLMAGDVNWKDVNGDNVIDDYDLVKIGNTTPHWIGGFNTTVSYKNFSFYAAFDYALGFYVMDYRLPWILGNMQGTYTPTMDVENTWTDQNPNAKYPTYQWADQLGKGNYRNSTLFTYKGDYLSFRQISLTYAVPNTLLKQAKIEKLELSVTGQNLGYLTAAKTMSSPESGGIQDAGYSLPRIVTFGLNVSF
ncbi:MAG: SusC/RagA family TonB-linked outer membrane protein [Prolixibacteraceae bacterium]|nr:SusC/RagA family TonB-linked outer membrane protein [Prolixibacteraceae bacterium]